MDWVSLETTYGKPYFDFLRHYEWLWYAGFDFSYVEDFSNQAWGDFFFHDVDHNGVVDLIIRAGTSVFDGECLIFTDVDGTVACMGQTSASGIGAALFGSEEENGLLMEDVYRGYLNVTEIGARETENGVRIETVDEYSIEMTEDDTGWHTDWTEPDGWYQLQPFSISDLLDAKYVRPSTFGDAFEVRDMGVSMTFPGEWDGHYRLYNSDASPELIVYCRIGGRDYTVFTITASGYTAEDDFVYMHGEEAVGTWHEDGRLLLVQRAIPDPDMVLHGSDEERALYWTFFDMRDGVIASIRNDPQG